MRTFYVQGTVLGNHSGGMGQRKGMKKHVLEGREEECVLLLALLQLTKTKVSKHSL